MRHPTRAGIGLVRFGDSDCVPANPEDGVRGKDVYDAQGQCIGSVEDLYIDCKDREGRFLEVGAGGFLRIGQKPFLVPVEAVTQVTEDRVTIEPGRTEKVEGPPPFDTKVAPLAQMSDGRATPRLRTATPAAPPTPATHRYGTSTGRTSGRRAGDYGPYGS